MKTRIFVVDDDPRVRQDLTALIDREADLEMCGDSGAGPEGLSRVLEARPDAVIVDLFAADGSGMELVRKVRLHRLGTSVIGFSECAEAAVGASALNEGAVSYVSKADSVVRLLLAIRNVRAIRMLSGMVPCDAPSWKISPPRASAADSRAA